MSEDHVHCMSCVNQRCTIRPQPGISCDIIFCPLLCGAVFHSCKVNEHHLLCPLLRVPCLNKAYGCPAKLVRNQMYAHLEVCPAGVVCCTMEWNRWPISSLDYTSYESLSHGVEKVEQLDMALALQDQRTLLESLKVIAITPSAKGEPHTPATKENISTDSASPLPVLEGSTDFEFSLQSSSSGQQQSHLPGSAKERILSGINGLNKDNFSELYEATAETARSLAAALEFVSGASTVDGSTFGTKKGTPVQRNRFNNGDPENGQEDRASEVAQTSHESEKAQQNVCSDCWRRNAALQEMGQKTSDTTHGPLPVSMEMETSVETVCPVVNQELNARLSQGAVMPLMASPAHVNQGVAQRAGHVVLDDRGLVLLGNHLSEDKIHCYQFNMGQGQWSLPKEQLSFLKSDSLFKVQRTMEDKAVDTSDLEQVDDPMGVGEIDLITAALLFCLEESRECRRISDTVYVDGYHVDFGTQTFTFPAAILVTNTRVGDMSSASACDHAAPQLPYPSPFRILRLGLVLEALEVEAVPHNRYLPANPHYQHMFPFICGQSFRRDQFSSHFKNVHSDIHAGLNGWMERRCPMAYYGCTFSQRRFYPAAQGAVVIHDKYLRSFGVQPCPKSKFPGDSQSDQFSGLPTEILWRIAGFLDSFSLCQLSLVSRTMREVCASLLQNRGIVELQWERCPAAPGKVSWQIKNRVWRFSTAFSPVLSWGFSDLPSMSEHLKKCQFNVVERNIQPVPLPAMCTARDGHLLRHVLRHLNT
ncbi:F-box only protein 30-like [Antennarius striatus]|uniref:F-box only protein 30-like n=1 Tax=Antennarius striatus TaxID=241820 RepID=UPI0035B3904E